MVDQSPTTFWIFPLIIAIGTLLSAVIPPFQSPDEFDHIRRAYLWSKGTILLETQEEKASGGLVDTGLTAYMAVYNVLPFQANRKLSAEEIDSAAGIRWTGVKDFVSTPGTGYYFPAIYSPQAIGLAIGELFGLSIDLSYRIARFCTLLSIAILLFYAFGFYSVNPITIALLLLPMSIFQLSSASLDGISIALAIFAISAYLKITLLRENSSNKLFAALAISVFLLATSRVYLLPLLLLVLSAGLYTKRKKHYLIFLGLFVFVVTWLGIAISSTNDTRVVKNAPTSTIALYYIESPVKFFDVLSKTLSKDNLVDFYRESFLGNLGWHDARFSNTTYSYLLLFLVLIGLLSISLKNIKKEWIPRALLIFCTFSSVLLIFFALLLAWNTHPARVVLGVQGRYFIIPALMLGYAISGRFEFNRKILGKLAIPVVLIFGIFTLSKTTQLLLERYYTANEQPKAKSVSMRAGSRLGQDKPIIITNGTLKNNQTPLRSIAILLHANTKKLPGSAELRLTTLDGHLKSIPIDLSKVIIDQYNHFDLDSIPYNSGEIVFLTGGGLSAWETAKKNKLVATCIILEYENGMRHFTRGCPRS